MDDLAFSHNILTTEIEVLDVLKIIQDFDPVGIGARDLQEQITIKNKKLYEILIEKLNPIIKKNIGNHKLSSIGIVTGATYAKELQIISVK